MKNWKQLRHDFNKPQNSFREDYYDLYEDWDLIVASFAKQYGIRLRTVDDMNYSEFCSLLSGIMPNTPLGNIVSIRSEKDPKVLKNFSKEQREIRNKWILKRNEKLKANPEAYNAYVTNLQRALASAFGGGKP